MLNFYFTYRSFKAIEGLGINIFTLFVYWGIVISCLAIAYTILWQVTLVLNLTLIFATILSFLLLKVSSNNDDIMEIVHLNECFFFNSKISSNQRYKKETILARATAVAEELFSSIRTVKAFEGEADGIKRSIKY